MRKRLSKNRKRGDHKAYQFDKWGNVIDDSIGEAAPAVALGAAALTTGGRLAIKKSAKKILSKVQRSSLSKGPLTTSVSYDKVKSALGGDKSSKSSTPTSTSKAKPIKPGGATYKPRAGRSINVKEGIVDTAKLKVKSVLDPSEKERR